MRKRENRFLAVLILIFSLVFISCDSWMTGDNFFDKIADEVKYANAEKINVYVRYPNRNMGETSPNGKTTQKVDIPFSVTAVDANNYGFYKWAAFSTEEYSTIQQYNIVFASETAYERDYADKELGEDEVVFEDPRSPVTTARVLHDRNDVFIMPICVRRPYIQLTRPADGDTGVVKNSSIIMSFSSPMNPDDLLCTVEGSTFKTFTSKISIQPYTSTFTGPIFGDLRSYLTRGGVEYKMSAALSANNTVLTISLPEADPEFYLPVDSFMMVTVSGEIRDALGYEMGNDAQISFRTCGDTDVEKPKVIDLEVGSTHLKRNVPDVADVEELPRAGKILNVRAFVGDKAKADETTFSDNVNMVYYEMYKFKNPSNDMDLGTGAIYDSMSGGRGYGGSVNLTASPKAELEATQTMGTTFSIDMSAKNYESDGLWYIKIWGSDTVGNEGDNSSPVLSTAASAANPPESKYIYFIRDTLAPLVDNSQIVATATGNGAPYGWFNSSTISNIIIKESSAGTIKDLPNYDNVYRSDKVWWAFYMGTDSTTWSESITPESESWSLVSSTGVALSTLVGSNIDTSAISEGNVPLYVKFRDDVGNISDIVTLDAINYDGTAPTLGDLSWTSKNSYVAPGIADSKVLGNQQLVIPFTENLSGIKKIKITVEDPDGIEYDTPFGASTIAVRTSASGDAWSGTVDANGDFIFTDAVSSSYNKLYIDNLKISDDDTLTDGTYTVTVKLYDTALNATQEKSIDLDVDSVDPVITKSYFDGIVNDALTPNRTFTTHSDNNTLYIDVTENGSGIQKIALFHCTGSDPYTSGVNYCRNIVTTSGTKLYKSTDNGLTYSEVTCSIDTGYVGSEYAYILTIPQNKAIKGTGVLLKITGLTIADPSYKNDCAGAAGLKLYDFAANESSFGDSDKVVGKSIAGIIEDQYSPQVSDGYSIGDSGKRINGSNALVATEGIPAASGYTKTPFVTMVFYVNEYAGNNKVTTCSGLRKIVLDGAVFTPQTEIEFCQNTNVSFNGYGNTWYTLKSLGDKPSVEACDFKNTVPAGDTSEGGFYIVNGNTAVLRIPVSVSQSYSLTIRYAKLADTSADGEKTVKASFYDTARQLDTTADNQKTMKIKYSSTNPVIKVKATGGDPEAITAADIQKLVPRNNGLQSYAEDTTAWVYSYDSQDNRRGDNTTPSGNGVYTERPNCPYFDLDITSSAGAKLMSYAYTFDNADMPASDSGDWNSTSSDKVNVTFPTYSTEVEAYVDRPARDVYLHVADYAGNVTTKKMSVCKWINEVAKKPWPKRNTDGENGKKMVNGSYYLEGNGLYNNSEPKFTVTFPAGTTGPQKVYIPPTWFNKVSPNAAPIYGYALGTHTRYADGHTDISLAKRDAGGPYLELSQSFFTEIQQNGGQSQIFFYVYDAVGEDLTAVVEGIVDNHKPWFEASFAPKGATAEENMHLKWKENDNFLTVGSDYTTINPDNRITVGVSYNDKYKPIHTFLRSGGVEGYKTWGIENGLTAANPYILYTDADSLIVTLLTRKAGADSTYPNEGDTLKYIYTINEGEPTEISDEITNSFTSWPSDETYFYSEDLTITVPDPATPGTPINLKLTAVDKGANTSDLYFRIYKDNVGPVITASDVKNVNQITETVDGNPAKINYFGSTATAKVTVTDALVGLATVNNASCTTYENVETNLATGGLTYDTTDKSLKLKATDLFGNAANSSMVYNEGTLWIKDTDAPNTPTLTYDNSDPFAATNSIRTGYDKYNTNGLSVSGSGSTWTVKYVGGVNEITVKPEPYTYDTDVMGYVSLSDYSSVKTFYAKSEVSQSFAYAVSPLVSPVTRYIYAVDKAGNPSSSYLTITMKLNESTPILESVSGEGLYSSGSNGWFKENAYVDVNVSKSPSQYVIGYGHLDGQWEVKNYTSSRIKIPESYDGKQSIWLAFYSGGWSADYFISAPNGTVTQSASNTVTKWTLDKNGPAGLAVNSVSASGTNGNAYKASGTQVFYNDSATGLTITPTAGDGTNGSGVKGYSTSSTGNPETYITLSSPFSSSVTIYAFDNVGNTSSQTVMLTQDTLPPSVTIKDGSMSGCIPIGSTLYFKDQAKLELSILDSGSGVSASSPLKDNAEIKLYTTAEELVIPSGEVFDNVGNTQKYILKTNIVKDDAPPSVPLSLTGASSSDGNVYRDGSTVYYNADATTITLELSGASDPAGGSGLAGYTASGVTVEGSDASSITISRTGASFPASISIQSKDGVGNVSSSGYTVTLKKDADSPEVSIASLVANTGKTYNGNPTYFYYNDNGSYAQVKLSIQDNSGGSGLASSSWANNKQINITGYLNSSNNTIEITNPAGDVKIVDNVGNTETYSLKYNGKPIIYDATGPDTPTISEVAVTGSGAKKHQDGNTIYYNDKTTGITITPSADDNPGGCGVAGYSTTSTGTPKSTIVVSSTIPTYVDIYAIDNLGNASSYLRVSLVKDSDPPSVSITAINGGKTYPSGSTMFYRDEGMNTVKATLRVLDDVSGIPASGSYTTDTTLDVSAQLDSDGKIAIENNKVFDNVGNTQAYALVYTDGATSYTFKKDEAPPTTPSGFKVYSTTGGSSSDYYVTGTADANGFYPSTSKIYYNANVTGITLQFNGSTDTGGSGVKGYAASYSDTITSNVALDLTASSITVFAFDNLANKSTSGFTVQYAKDDAAPTFTLSTPISNVTTAKAPNGWTVNTYASGTTLSFTITDVSGLAAYDLVYHEGDGNDYSSYTESSGWTDATGNSITLTLPATSHYNTNYMLLLKDKLGNVTKADGTGTSAYASAAVTNGSNGWWCSEPATKSFAAKSKIDGNNLEVELTGVDFAVSKIAVTATGITGISGKVKFMDYKTNEYKDIDGSYSGGTITISDKYLSYNGIIKFTLTGDTNLALPTAIKLNDSVEVTTIGSLSLFAGYRKFSLISDAADTKPARPDPVVQGLTRNITVGDLFTALASAPDYAEIESPVSFTIGKNMETISVEPVAEPLAVEKAVTNEVDSGYIIGDTEGDNLPPQNLAWKAPDGPVIEESGLENQAVSLNSPVETGSSSQVFSASDTVTSDAGTLNPALILSLLAILTLGALAVFVRRKTVE